MDYVSTTLQRRLTRYYMDFGFAQQIKNDIVWNTNTVFVKKYVMEGFKSYLSFRFLDGVKHTFFSVPAWELDLMCNS